MYKTFPTPHMNRSQPAGKLSASPMNSHAIRLLKKAHGGGPARSGVIGSGLQRIGAAAGAKRSA